MVLGDHLQTSKCLAKHYRTKLDMTQQDRTPHLHSIPCLETAYHALLSLTGQDRTVLYDTRHLNTVIIPCSTPHRQAGPDISVQGNTIKYRALQDFATLRPTTPDFSSPRNALQDLAFVHIASPCKTSQRQHPAKAGLETPGLALHCKTALCRAKLRNFNTMHRLTLKYLTSTSLAQHSRTGPRNR